MADLDARPSADLAAENALFESCLARAAARNPAAFEEGGEMALPVDAEGVTLDAHHRYEVAALEIDDIREETGEVRAQHEALMDVLRAQIEATDVRIAEIKKDAYEFKRDIVIGAESSRTGKTVAEKAVRYMDDKIRAKGAVTEKLRLKNSQLRAQAQKLEAQLQQKEDAGGSLRAVDFDQLKIENQQQLEKIEERNSELLRLKLTTGNTIHVLNSLKQRLAALNEESEWLRGEAAGRHAAIAKLADEAKRVDAERERAARLERKAKREAAVAETSKMPNVMEYVQQKAQAYELEKRIASLRKKCELAEMAVRREARRARGGLG